MLRLGKTISKHCRILRGFSTGAELNPGAHNSIYVDQMYSRWLKDKTSVHSSWNLYFSKLDGAEPGQEGLTHAGSGHALTNEAQVDSSGRLSDNVFHEKLAQMIFKYRKRAHEVADTDPLNIALNHFKYKYPFVPVEDSPEQYGFTKDDLNRSVEFFMSAKGFHTKKKTWTPLEASKFLRNVYMDKIGFEYIHIPSNEVQDWIREKIEHVPMVNFTKSEKEYLLDRIIESQTFTDFCEKKYSSAKRFGIDGLDAAVTGLEKLVDTAKEQGATNVVVGMAHRGRLNTLACVFDKPYEAIFTEFKDPGISKNIRSAEWGFSGDVKYHLGASQKRYYKDGTHINLVSLSNTDHAPKPKSSRDCGHRGSWQSQV